MEYLKVYAQWVSRQIRDEQVELRRGICLEYLIRYYKTSEPLLWYEIWCHHLEPVAERMSNKKWRYPTLSWQKTQSDASFDNVMLTVFFWWSGTFNFGLAACTCHSQNWTPLWHFTKPPIGHQKKVLWKIVLGVLLLHDNATMHNNNAIKSLLCHFHSKIWIIHLILHNFSLQLLRFYPIKIHKR